MVLNPAAANVDSPPPRPVQTEVEARGKGGVAPGVESPFKQGVAQEFRQPLGLRPNSSPLYRIQFAGYGEEQQGDAPVSHDASFQSSIKGEHWGASPKVFSLAAFDAQLFVQMNEISGERGVTYRQGNNAYNMIKSVLEEAGVVAKESDQMVEGVETEKHINLRA
ncbi:MAG: hypothetical protein VX617_00605 [Pseudomonadota bacterium]|nr:hypothetical protein [Pseudomonadota bacterium]